MKITIPIGRVEMDGAAVLASETDEPHPISIPYALLPPAWIEALDAPDEENAQFLTITLEMTDE